MSGLGEALRESAVINLASASTMVVDDSPFALELTAQSLMGFGIRTRHACIGAAEAMEILRDQNIDLLVVDCDMPGIDGFELVRWLRRSGLEPNAFVPVIMTAAHIRRSRVAEARDCGANFIITKPFSAATLLERIVWVSRDGRPFLEVGDYFGPDRRFRKTPAPGDERRVDLIRKKAFEEQKAQAAAGVDAA
ncbi:MAG: response regulator [Alphaproteobacteria bacterium]|uniref:response regulator n=1 Tax=Brevundimonas sp. TaxID=1871086 RepID=UPI00184DAED5|nr:response regulator [Brevundimonas sp.]MBU3969959.1 response regulator [Alphaproteobacteria bacterium]MBA3048196.1 response regulator [Brevundimonas sp.]MBU3974918.1 response regulator [Alphaproteobacteria bacterium]MBU4040154.1 response regulator [Alphaproteobacteria bacterium]MBU4135758.1 response regulator [Alphaproteobacteria bacterium]